jgi:hypothetical protein
MKKIFIISSIFSITLLLGFFATYSNKKKVDQSISADQRNEDIELIKSCHEKYEELAWICRKDGEDYWWGEDRKEGRKTYNLYGMIRFLDSIVSGDYFDYLHLYIDIPEKKRLGYKAFIELHEQIQELEKESSFESLEFKDLLVYSLILSELVYTSEYRNRSWIYNITSTSELIQSHEEILPTLSRYSTKQKEYLKLITGGMIVEKVFEEFNANPSKDLTMLTSFLKDEKEKVDLCFFLIICRMAGTKVGKSRSYSLLTDGYYNYLKSFEKGLISHLE